MTEQHLEPNRDLTLRLRALSDDYAAGRADAADVIHRLHTIMHLARVVSEIEAPSQEEPG